MIVRRISNLIFEQALAETRSVADVLREHANNSVTIKMSDSTII